MKGKEHKEIWQIYVQFEQSRYQLKTKLQRSFVCKPKSQLRTLEAIIAVRMVQVVLKIAKLFHIISALTISPGDLRPRLWFLKHDLKRID